MSGTSIGAVYMDVDLNQKRFDSQVRSTVKKTESAFSSSFKKIGIGIASAFAVSRVYSFGKACVDAASQAQSAWTGLNSIVEGTGNNFAVAQSFINEYTKDGLMSVSEAVTAYKNLLARGYDTTQIENTMLRLKDAAAFGRQSSYTLGQAVVTATEGLKNENSILVDNAGVTKNVAKMWDEYAKSIGTTANNLTQAQKIQAEVNGIMNETRFQVGNAATYTSTFAGRVAQLKAAFLNMKTAIGKVVAPIASLFIPIITSAMNAVTKLFNGLQGILATFGLTFPDVVTKTSSSIADATGNITSMGDSATDTAGNLARTGDAATKAAKKIKRAFASVDEINVINTSNSSSGGSGSNSGGSDGAGGGTGGAGTSGVASMTTEVTQAAATSNSAFDQIKNKLLELKDLFKDGFELSFGDTNFDGILDHIENIKKSILDIFNDDGVQTAANNMIDKIAFALGQAVGSIARIGTNIAEGLVGAIDLYLSEHTPRIKDFLIKMFDITGEQASITGNFYTALGAISDVFKSDSAKQIGSDIIAMFTNPFMSITSVLGGIATDIYNVFAKPLIDNADLIKTSYENTFNSIVPLYDTLANMFTGIGDTISQVYENHIHPFFTNFATGFSDTFGKLLEFWNTYINPFIQNMAIGFQELYDGHLKGFFENVGKLLGSIMDAITVFWDNVLKPLIDWIIKYTLPVIVPILETIWNVVKSTIGVIIDQLSGLLEMLSGVIDFLTGVFTGDWDKAWNGVKSIFEGVWTTIKAVPVNTWEAIKGIWSGVSTWFNSYVLQPLKEKFTNIWGNLKTGASNAWTGIKNVFKNIPTWFKDKFTSAWTAVKNVFSTGGKIFSGIKEGIANVFKTIVNKIIDGINKVISKPFNAINKMLNKLRNLEILGVSPFGFIKTFSVPQIPKLAQGAYFGANNPQLAIVGDNKREGEIITPESKIREQVKEALNEINGVSNNLKVDFNIKITTDDGRTIIKKINDVTVQDGRVSLIV